MTALPTRSTLAILGISLFGMTVSANSADAENSQPVAKRVAELPERWDAWALAFRPNRQELATSSPDGQEVHIWQWGGQPQITKTLSILGKGIPNGIFQGGNPNGLLYSPDGQLLAVGHPAADGDKLVRVWNSDTAAVVHDVTDVGGGSRYFGIAFSPDGRSLLRSQDLGSLPEDSLAVDRTDSWRRSWGLRTNPFLPGTLALSRDGKLVALGGQVRVASDGTKPYLQPQIKVVSFDNRQITQSFDVLSANCELQFVAWSHDGAHIAVGGRPVFAGSRLTHATIQILDATKGTIAEYESGSSHLQALIFTPDGKFLIIGWDKVVEIWNSQRTEKLQSIPVEPTAVAVSSDGQYMAVAAIGKSITVWSMR